MRPTPEERADNVSVPRCTCHDLGRCIRHQALAIIIREAEDALREDLAAKLPEHAALIRSAP